MARSADNLNAVLQDTANAIKTKKGSQAAICPRDFADQVASIPTGITPTGTKYITTNGDHDVSAYANANVNVSGGEGKVSLGVLPISTAPQTSWPSAGDYAVSGSAILELHMDAVFTARESDWDDLPDDPSSIDPSSSLTCYEHSSYEASYLACTMNMHISSYISSQKINLILENKYISMSETSMTDEELKEHFKTKYYSGFMVRDIDGSFSRVFDWDDFTFNAQSES